MSLDQIQPVQDLIASKGKFAQLSPETFDQLSEHIDACLKNLADTEADYLRQVNELEQMLKQPIPDDQRASITERLNEMKESLKVFASTPIDEGWREGSDFHEFGNWPKGGAGDIRWEPEDRHAFTDWAMTSLSTSEDHHQPDPKVDLDSFAEKKGLKHWFSRTLSEPSDSPTHADSSPPPPTEKPIRQADAEDPTPDQTKDDDDDPSPGGFETWATG